MADPILHHSAFRRLTPGTLCGIPPHLAVVTRLAKRVTCEVCLDRLRKLAPDHVATLVRQLDDHYGAVAERRLKQRGLIA